MNRENRFCYSLHSVFSHLLHGAIYDFRSEEQKNKYLPDIKSNYSCFGLAGLMQVQSGSMKTIAKDLMAVI